MVAPAPKLLGLRIEGFRRIQQPLELDLRSPRGAALSTVVLAGPNGCGKTSVLEAILLGLGQEAMLLRDQEPKEREVSSRAELPPGVRIELTLSLDGGPLERWVRTRDSLARREHDGTMTRLDGPDGLSRPELRVEYFSSWRWPRLVGSVQPLAPGRFPSPTEANRPWRIKRRIADERARIGFQQTEPGQQIIPGTSRADIWLGRINDVWALFHGNDGTQIDISIVEPVGEEEGLQADLFVMRGRERVCSVDRLSAGELELLSLADWFILRDARDGLVLIDEPELHLHAQWQATIGRALRRLAPDAQLIMTTHSPILWDQAYGFERFLLVPEDDPRSREWRERHASSPLPGSA
jgi:energy-coupling factor transporter ATP-binding protein EcfA2